MSDEPLAVPFSPRTAHGRVTRAALVEAARVVFEREGFTSARISDITTTARVSTGSFYTYFADKHAALTAVLDGVREEMLPNAVPGDAHADPLAVIEAANRAYFLAYERNATLMALVEHVSMTDPAFRALRISQGRLIEERNAAGIARLQAQGRADPALDPDLASRALSGMVSRLAFRAFVAGEASPVEDLVAVATRLWANGLGLATPPTSRLRAPAARGPGA